jgi:hypothetical protein
MKESKLATVGWIVAGFIIGLIVPTIVAYAYGLLDPIFVR